MLFISGMSVYLFKKITLTSVPYASKTSYPLSKETPLKATWDYITVNPLGRGNVWFRCTFLL